MCVCVNVLYIRILTKHTHGIIIVIKPEMIIVYD